jgi:hypothetical protein
MSFRLSFEIPFASLGPLSAQQGRGTWPARYNAKVHSVMCTLDIAANQDVVIDINRDGGSVFADQSKRPRILAGTNDLDYDLEANGVAFYVSRGTKIRVDIDQVGTGGSPGENLSVSLEYSYTGG